MEQEYKKEITIGGSNDRCLECQYLGVGCSGANTNVMEFERYVEWMRALRALRRSQGKSVSFAQIADAVGIAKNTVENFFAGKNKDASRTTMCRIERYLIGNSTLYPCAMDLVSNKDVVYQDRPETLEALAQKDKILDEIHSAYKQEMDTLRAEYQRIIDHLLKENDRMDRIINKLLEK